MPIVSKYSNERVENLVQALIDVLVDQKATTDLALMSLGNTLTHVISQQVPEEQQQALVTNFTNALQKSLPSKSKNA